MSFYKKRGRDLPWRQTKNPYRILVSEIMLQQTQVDRVIPKYTSFIKKFPTIRKLATAPLGEVLREWQGLGYNRRAKMLHEAVKNVVASHRGNIPEFYADLVALPGIGDYTAKAVRVFAWNKPEILIETNIRSVFLHHFFLKSVDARRTDADLSRKIHDKELLVYIEQTLYSKNPRNWYAALMDYGSYLKKTVSNPSRKSAHHTKQKPFKGSDREVRGALLRLLSQHSQTEIVLYRELPFQKSRIQKQLRALLSEGLVVMRGSRACLP